MADSEIIVAVDLSDNSVFAAQAAAWLCRKLGASATLTHALPSPSIGKAREQLRRLDAGVFKGVTTQMQLVAGAPAAAICDVATERRSALIVMGTHGVVPSRCTPIGETAGAVVRRAPCDVLTVRPPSERLPDVQERPSAWVTSLGGIATVNRILCPLDFSEPSEKALRRAVHLAKKLSSALSLLTVVDFPLWQGLATYFESADRAYAHAGERMKATVARLQKGGLDVDGHVIDGQPSTVIRRVSEELGADLIVMGTHGRTGIERWALGSVAEEAIRASPIPVWTVRLVG